MSFWTGSRVVSVAVGSFLLGCHTTYSLMEDPRFAIQSLRFLNPKSSPIRAEMPLLASSLRSGFVRETDNPEEWTVFTMGWGSSKNSYRKREPVVEKKEVKKDKGVPEAIPVSDEAVGEDEETDIVRQEEGVELAEKAGHQTEANNEDVVVVATPGKPKKSSQTN